MSERFAESVRARFDSTPFAPSIQPRTDPSRIPAYEIFLGRTSRKFLLRRAPFPSSEWTFVQANGRMCSETFWPKRKESLLGHPRRDHSNGCCRDIMGNTKTCGMWTLGKDDLKLSDQLEGALRPSKSDLEAKKQLRSRSRLQRINRAVPPRRAYLQNSCRNCCSRKKYHKFVLEKGGVIPYC